MIKYDTNGDKGLTLHILMVQMLALAPFTLAFGCSFSLPIPRLRNRESLGGSKG